MNLEEIMEYKLTNFFEDYNENKYKSIDSYYV